MMQKLTCLGSLLGVPVKLSNGIAKEVLHWEQNLNRSILSFLSILYLKNMDQMKHGSFIKKMAEDFTIGWENVYPIHFKDV